MADLDRESYLSQRVDDQLGWLSQKSRGSKRLFMRLSIFEILLGTAITVFSPYSQKIPWGSFAIAVAGGGIAVSSSLLALTRSQENWVRYRSLAEQLKREKFLFATGTRPYDAKGEDAFHEFVDRVESLMLEERGSWARTFRGEPSAPGDNPSAVASSSSGSMRGPAAPPSDVVVGRSDPPSLR